MSACLIRPGSPLSQLGACAAFGISRLGPSIAGSRPHIKLGLLSAMGRDKRSCEEIAVDEGLRADERRVGQIVAKVCTGVRNHPSKARAVWDLLASVGITEQNYKQPETVEQCSAAKKAALKRKQTMADLKEKAKQQALDMATAQGAVEPISSECTHLNKCTIPFLRDLCKDLAPNVLGINTLQQHSRSLRKDGLVEIIQFLTGCSHDLELYPHIVCKQKLSEMMKQWASDRGDRASRGFSMPPVWAVNGIYRILSVAQHEVVIGHRYTLARYHLHLSELPGQYEAGRDYSMDDVKMIQNYSESNSAVAFESEMSGYPMHRLCDSHSVVKDELEEVITPAPKKNFRSVRFVSLCGRQWASWTTFGPFFLQNFQFCLKFVPDRETVRL